MKILTVPDIMTWAIGHLVQTKVNHNTHHIYKIVPIPPRDALEKADEFEQIVKEFNPDIIHYEYFRTAEQLINTKPFLKNYKSVLTHQNQRGKALFHADWKALGIDSLVCATTKTRQLLADKGQENIEIIQYGVDTDFFSYSDEEPKEQRVGYAGRIVPWKRLRDIAQVCNELDYRVLFMGRQDKADYWKQFTDEEARAIDFSFMDCKDEERVDYYRNLTCYVGFSQDDYEEGTLELLEAMACGVPVITTSSGLARDIISNEKNGLLVDFNDKEQLKHAITRVMTDKKLRDTLRKNAWETVKIMTEKKMAYEYSKLYHKVYKPEYPLVSVIIPTYNRKEQIIELLRNIKNQTYPHIEAIICDDNSTDNTLVEVLKFRENNPELTIKIVETGKDGYNLAMARNMGAIESEGDYLVFIDSRLKIDENAVMFFKESIDGYYDGDESVRKTWFFGNKGSNKKSFVENFSALKRKDFFNFGMFCERIDKYGGMSQEIRTRWINQGGSFFYLSNVEAEQQISAVSKNKRRKDIKVMKFKLLRMYGNSRY